MGAHEAMKRMRNKLISNERTFMTWLRDADPKNKPDKISKYGVKELLGERMRINVEPRDVEHMWTRLVSTTNRQYADVFNFANALSRPLFTAGHENVKSGNIVRNVHRTEEDDVNELGFGAELKRRKARLNRIRLRHEAQRVHVDADRAIEMLRAQFSSKRTQIRRIFNDVASADGKVSRDQFGRFVFRVNVYVRADELHKMWQRLERNTEDGRLDFHTFGHRLRQAQSMSTESSTLTTSSFFCGEPSYDRHHRRSSRSSAASSSSVTVSVALDQLRDRVVTQRDVVLRVFKDADRDRTGSLDMDTFRDVLSRRFFITLKSFDFDRLWCQLVGDARERTVAYRELVVALGSGHTGESSSRATSTARRGKQEQHDGSRGVQLTAVQAVEMLKRDVRLRKTVSAYADANGRIRQVGLQRLLDDRDMNLRPGAFRQLWRLLNSRGEHSIDLRSVLFPSVHASGPSKRPSSSRREY